MCGVSKGGIYIEKSNYRQDIIFMLRLNSFFLLLFPFCKRRYGIQLFDKALHPFTDLCFGCKNQLSIKELSNFFWYSSICFSQKSCERFTFHPGTSNCYEQICIPASPRRYSWNGKRSCC